MLKRLALPLALLLLVAAVLALAMFRQARADPVVRRAEVILPGLEPGTRLTAVLLADIHMGSRAMDAPRLTRIAAQVNALDPDLVLIAGDLFAGHEPGSADRLAPSLVAPLASLHPRLGTVAVLGNHDWWTGAAVVRAALGKAGVTVLDNEAVARGPVAIGLVGDNYTRHDRLGETVAAARRTGKPFVILTHSPDIAPELPADARLLLAGHTHCGQARVFGVTLAPEVSRYGERYRCGLVREGGRTVVVTAGLGTSSVPMRLGTPPDLWLLTIRSP